MIKILHLFNNLMNLYGDIGNVRILEKRLKMQNTPVSIVKAMPDELENFDFDFIYMGSGTEKSLFAALEKMRKFKETFIKKLEEETLILLTGNSVSLFGKSIKKFDGLELEGLGILDIETIETYDTPTMQDCIFDCELINKKVVGFINRATEIKSNEKYLFNVDFGVGNSTQDKYEGIQKNNLFATHLIGPLLVKNPDFLEFIIKKLANKTKKFEYKKMDFEEMKAAYDITLHELLKRKIKSNNF